MSERTVFRDRERTVAALDNSRGAGQVVGWTAWAPGISASRFWLRIRWDYLKADRSLVARAETPARHRGLLAPLFQYAASIGARLVGEDTEQPSLLRLCREAGVPSSRAVTSAVQLCAPAGIDRQSDARSR